MQENSFIENQVSNIQAQNILQALHEINIEFIRPKSNKRSLFKKMLDKVLAITSSEYGFIGEIITREGAPLLKTYAITDISWNEETAALYKKYEAQGMEFTNLNTLFGYTIRTGEVVISNDPANDSKRGGLPKGHPALNHYLGIPVKDNNNVMIGMIGIANKPGGYSESDLLFLEPMISLTAAYISAIKDSEAKQFFSGTLDLYKKAIDDHAIVSVTDVNGNIIYVNEKFCELSKFTSAELIGKNHVIVNSGYHSKEFFNKLWSTILSGKVWNGEIRNRAKDGSIYWVNATLIPFLDENKKPYQFIAIRNDITKLKEQERELSNFFRLSLDLLCIITAEGKFIKVSESFPKVLGYTEDELLETAVMDLIHPNDRLSTQEQIEKMLAGDNTLDFENRYRKKDGGYLLLSWKGSLNKEDGLIYGTATDITSKKEIEEKLIQSKIEMEKAKAKDIFLANMSHEIRTPLNAIIGFNDLLSKTSLNPEQAGHVTIIGNALKNLNVIINDILDLSKLESGKLELEKLPFNVESTIKQVIQIHLAKAKAKNIRLVLSFDSAIPEYIIGDETRLSQMLINLVSNAVKFTNQGSVEIKVMEQERIDNKVRLCFNICDTGIGIEPDKLNLIFERFTQAEDYTTRLYGGTGLGLNIVKSLVDLHEGDLRVQSTLGKGSEFILELTYPVANTIYSENTLPSNEVLSEVPLKGYSILLVEDNEHNQILAKTYLERAGALIDIAGNGLVGLDSLSKNTYDLIIMDIQMPVMDGIRATEIIRKELSLNIPIIGCSAHALESEKLRCFSAGMNDYITKPYSQLDLVSAVLRLKIEKSMPNYTSNEHSQSTIPSGELEDVNEIFKNWEYQLGKEIADKLMTALLKRIPNDISNIETYVKSSDYSNLESATHNLAGSLGGLNIMNGMRLTRKLEESCKSNNKVVIESIADDLLRYLNHLLLQLS